jgi:hypothetical protein
MPVATPSSACRVAEPASRLFGACRGTRRPPTSAWLAFATAPAAAGCSRTALDVNSRDQSFRQSSRTSPVEGLDKSILDLPVHAASGACPIAASTNQALTCLIRGPAILRPAEPPNNQRFPNGTSQLIQRSLGFSIPGGASLVLRRSAIMPLCPRPPSRRVPHG